MLSFPVIGRYFPQSHLNKTSTPRYSTGPQSRGNSLSSESSTFSNASFDASNSCDSNSVPEDVANKTAKDGCGLCMSKKSKYAILTDLLHHQDPEQEEIDRLASNPIHPYNYHFSKRQSANSLSPSTSLLNFTYDSRTRRQDEPSLVINWESIPKFDKNYDLRIETFPKPRYITKYFQKLGFTAISGNDIAPPYDFGYYAVPQLKTQSVDDSPYYAEPKDKDGGSWSGTSVSSRNKRLIINISTRKRQRKSSKKALRYGVRCGHCNRFVKIKNESPEGGFLSFIAYFRHWITYHYNK